MKSPKGVRLTFQVRSILVYLSQDPTRERYGREIFQSLHMEAGTGYPALTRMEMAGWISSRMEDIDEALVGRRKRRYYVLTDSGRNLAAEVAEESRRLLMPTSATA